MRRSSLISLAAVWFLPAAAFVCAQPAQLDLSSAAVVADPAAPLPVRTAARMLAEEVNRRTLLEWNVVPQPTSGRPCVSLRVEAGAGRPAEGYRIAVGEGGPCLVNVTGNDPRGVLFGAGKLLRNVTFSRRNVSISRTFRTENAPKFAIRGHQLGFRSANNTYDAWSVADYEQYLRDMAVFGANTVELTGTGDGSDLRGAQFRVPPAKMHREIARLAAEYGLDLSVWMPATAKNYADPVLAARELDEWEAAFRSLPNLDAVFVPGGDPGHTEPRTLMPFLAKAAERLHRVHPKATLWVSPQGMDDAWMAQFYAEVRKRPTWLGGVVHGPWVRVPMAQFRKELPAGVPIRLYPDITHTLRCQFPMRNWDPAYAFVHGREPINPLPRRQAEIFAGYIPGSAGFVTYSDGANDDLNKVIWTGLGWDPTQPVDRIVREYASYFTGRTEVADGLLALERNWQGPVAANGEVPQTLARFQALERTAPPQLLRNWRFQQMLYRAYADAYTQRRLLAEREQEAEAREALGRAGSLGARSAIDAARTHLARAATPVSAEWRTRISALAEALFQSIGTQLSVARYGASGWERGATLDTIDAPLNNRTWMEAEFQRILALPGEPARLQAIEALLHREDPGPGGYYDDLGDPSRQPHFVSDGGEAEQGFWERLSGPLAWLSHANSWRGRPVRLRYTDLDPEAGYKVRVVYGGEPVLETLGIRLRTGTGLLIHDFLKKPAAVATMEFSIPREATRGGELVLEWDREEPPSGRLRGAQVSEVWLLREPR